MAFVRSIQRCLQVCCKVKSLGQVLHSQPFITVSLNMSQRILYVRFDCVTTLKDFVLCTIKVLIKVVAKQLLKIVNSLKWNKLFDKTQLYKSYSCLQSCICPMACFDLIMFVNAPVQSFGVFFCMLMIPMSIFGFNTRKYLPWSLCTTATVPMVTEINVEIRTEKVAASHLQVHCTCLGTSKLVFEESVRPSVYDLK